MNTATKPDPVINMHPVKSSQIHSIGHHPESNTLAIQFTGKDGKPGSVYRYDGFTAQHFEDFKNAESTGSHFFKHIKHHGDKFPCRKIS